MLIKKLITAEGVHALSVALPFWNIFTRKKSNTDLFVLCVMRDMKYILED